VVENDGRNHLLLSAPGAYDVVISEPPNPWITGVANLFTRDFFELGKTRLAPGGVWAQWVHLYGMAPSDLRSLLGTFADAYPYVAVYGTIEDADLVMVGSEQPLEVGLDGAQRLWGHSPALRKELRRVDVDSPMSLTSRYLFDRDAALGLADGVGRNTDDNMRIEYAAPYNLHLSTHGQNSAMLIGALQVPESYQDPDVLEELAWVYRERDDYVRAVKSLLRAARIVGAEQARARGWGDLVTEWRRELSER